MDKEILLELREIRKSLGLQKAMLTLDEFCLYTGFSKNYAYKLTSSGKIRCYRPSHKTMFFQLEDVIDFLKQNPTETLDSRQDKLGKYLLKSK